MTCYDYSSERLLHVEGGIFSLTTGETQDYSWAKGTVSMTINDYESWQYLTKAGTAYRQVWDVREEEIAMIKYEFADANGVKLTSLDLTNHTFSASMSGITFSVIPL